MITTKSEILERDAVNKKIATPASLDSRTGWGVVLAAVISTFAAFGVTYSFGASFTAIRDEFGVGKGQVALFFAITTFVYFILGIFTGRLADRFGPRPVLLFGAGSIGVGLLLTSLVNNIWLGYLTYGGGVGIGVACAYVPMVAAVGGWFEKNRTKALGFAVAGIGVGTLVGAPASKFLVNNYGWRTSFVILAITSSSLLVLASFTARKPPVSNTGQPAPSLKALLKDSRFIWLYCSMLLLSSSLFIPMVYLDDYLESQGGSGGALLIGIIGATSVIGRLALGTIANKIGLSRLYILAVVILSSSYILWIVAGSNYTVLVVFTVIMGVSYGGWIALSPSITAQLFGPVGLGGVLGALYTSAGIGGLIGPPLTGIIIDSRGYPFAISLVMIVAFCSLPPLVKALRAKAPEGKETFDIPVTFFILDLLNQITEDYDNGQASENPEPTRSL